MDRILAKPAIMTSNETDADLNLVERYLAGDLTALVCGDLPGRKSAQELTAFVFRGVALGDLAVAGLAYHLGMKHLAASETI